MLRSSALKTLALAIASSATIAHAQQPVVVVTNQQPVAVAAPASVVVTPQTVALPQVAAPATVVHPVPGVNSLAASVPPQPTIAVTNTIPAAAVAQQTQIYTPTYYYYYYQPQQAAPAYPTAWQQMPVAPVAPIVPVAPVVQAPLYDLMNAGYVGQFGPLFNARGEAGHIRYPYYSYRRPWYYPGQPSFNVTIPGHVW